MARKMTAWPSKRGPITKIMPSDGCIGDTVPLAVGKWYDFHEFGWYMGNVGLYFLYQFMALIGKMIGDCGGPKYRRLLCTLGISLVCSPGAASAIMPVTVLYI